nr:hypothetical protein [Tanacetum cinerariifolium]
MACVAGVYLDSEQAEKYDGRSLLWNSKIRTKTTPMALFNEMAILNDYRKKCLHEMGFGSMIGMGIHELLGKLVNDILGIPMGGCLIESLEPRTPNDPFIKQWLSQFGEKTEIRSNDISDVIVSTKDAGKLFKMNFLMLFANTMGLCETSDAEAVELSSSIKRCGHPMKHSYNLDIKEDQDAKKTPFEFADRKDEQTVHNADTSKNVNEKCTTKESTNVEQAETQIEMTEIINECHIDDFVEMILAKFKNIHYNLRSLSEELYEGLSRFPNCVKLNELNKKFQEDFCNKDLARNEDVEDANVANPSEAVNFDQASPIAQVSRAAILHASPIRMTKKAAKQTDVNKSSVEYTKDNSNDEDNEDSHSAKEEQNTEDSESVKTPPVKKCGRPKKIVRANDNKSSSVKIRGCLRKSNDESKKKTIGSKRKGREYKVDDDDENNGTKQMKKKSKISDENNKNSKIHTRTTPIALFNVMAILNGDRKKCLHEMGFGSMIGMGIHKLSRKLGFYVIDHLDTEANVLSLTDNSILVTSQSVHDILGIPIGGCLLESLAPRNPDDPFIKQWFSQFGEKNEVRPNDITDVIVSTMDAGKLFKMNFCCCSQTQWDCVKHQNINKLVKKFEEDFKKKDLVRNDENDDTTGTINDKNDLLHFDSKMESDSPAYDDDGKQDVVMDEIDEQNKEDVCKEGENKCVEIMLTFKRRAWRKKSVMDNENKDAEAVELSSSIKRCGHPMKHSYNLDVKDINEPLAEKINNKDQDAEKTPFEFADRKDERTVHNADTSKNVNEKCTAEENEQNNDDSDLSNNADAKSEKEDEEFDALSITICNVSHPVPLQIINIEDSESEKEEFDFGEDTDNEEKEIVFETYEGFKVLAIEMETLATGLDVHYEVINAWCDVLNTIEKDRKDYDKTHFYVICFDLRSGSFVLIENNYVENDSTDRDLGIPKALDLVRNDENDDTTGTTNDKNDLLHFDSKMESDSPASDNDNQKSDDDDGKQDVVMDEVDEQNKEDVCKESHSIHENKCVAIRLTFKRRAWRKKSVMDNENKDVETVELSSSIKRCGHPMKHSYNLDVKDVNEPIAKKINNEDQDAEETPFEFADRKDEKTVQNADTLKNVNEKCTAEESTNVEQAETQVETTEIINECHIDVDSSKNEIETIDTGDQTVKHNDANEDTGNTNSAFVDIRDEQNNDDSDLSNNADAKSEKEDEEFDALAITICNVCHPVPLQIINVEDSESEKEEFDFGGDTDNEEKYESKKDVDSKVEFYKSPYELKSIEPKIYVSASEKLVADTLFAMIYKPREIVFETYEGFKVLAIEMETLATGLDVHYEVINAWCDVLNTIEKDKKDYDKPVRKYCFKTGFLQANFLDKNVDANMKVKNFEKKLKEAVNSDTTLIKLQQIQFHYIFVDFMQSIEHRSYKKLRRAKLEVVKLAFKKRNDHVDCGIIVMTAIDCYMGEVKKLKDMFLEEIPYTQLVNLRQMIATKIMMSKINIRNDYDDSIDEVDPNIIMKEVFTDINKSSAEYTEDNSNDEDNEHSHSAEEEQNTENSDSVKTRPVKKRGRPKKIVRANEKISSSVKRRGRPRKSNDESKKQTIGSKRKGRE